MITHRFIDAGGVRTHVAEAGDGDPILLLHGFPQHWYAWSRVIPHLAPGYRVLCPDFAGSGRSAPPDGRVSTRQRVNQLLALLDALDLDRVRLAGHDWGAWTGFALCLRAPERVTHFAALNMMHPWPQHRRLVAHAWRFWYTALIEYPFAGRRVLQHYPAVARRLLRGVPDAEEFVAASRTPVAARAGQQLHWSFVTDDIPDLVRGRYRRQRLTVPTLLLAGGRDRIIAPGMLSAAANVRIEVIDHAGHQLPHEAPEEVAMRIRAHVESSAALPAFESAAAPPAR
ncbi:alpha/beta hydrolase [Dactylosporangium sp. NPDC051485]|uniref:alpha/beta fold hydrolase n=1 Tax=Dactylosporangium sp. NPDC051485 TaxID=3154846 RepID=UPI00342A878C